jgi:peroxiredoxin
VRHVRRGGVAARQLSYRACVKVGELVPAALADAIVRDGTGGEHRLGDAWATRDALVIFVRHFACAGCAEHVAALRPRLAELAQLDVGVIVVGSGTPDQLAGFIEREAIATAFTDPTLAAYRAAKLVRSRWSAYGPRALAQLARALLRGFANGRPQGDPIQQGGTLYVARDGVLRFYDRAEATGDHASLGDVVDVALARRALEAVA